SGRPPLPRAQPHVPPRAQPQAVAAEVHVATSTSTATACGCGDGAEMRLCSGRGWPRDAAAGVGRQGQPAPAGRTVHAYSKAVCRHRSYRPDTPPWPALISQRSSTGRSAELAEADTSRSRATHLAGSTYSTRVSLSEVTARIAGCVTGSMFSYGE